MQSNYSELYRRHISTHSQRSAEDRAAVSTLKTFLISDGKINTNFSCDDKWPNHDGTFEFVSEPEISRCPEQNFIVQIKGTHNYKEVDGIISYSLTSLAFPAFIASDVKNKSYRIVGSYIKSKKGRKQEKNYTTILYFIDETYMKELEKKVEDNNICIGMIMIDNYEELNQRVSLEEKTILMAKIEKKIYEWASKYNALILKSERDTFHCIVAYNQLKKIMEDKVAILDEIKKIEV